jgi:hypothetical protein
LLIRSSLPSFEISSGLTPENQEIDSIWLFPDFSALLSTDRLKVAINTSFPNYSSLFNDSGKLKSYVLILILTRLATWDSLTSLDKLLEKVGSYENVVKLKSELSGFIYSISKVPAKKILMKSSEAKELFLNEPGKDFVEKELKNNSTPPMATRTFKIRTYSPTEEGVRRTGSENTESLEYSSSMPSEQSDDLGRNDANTEPIKFAIKNSNLTNFRIQECESPEFSLLENSEKTPLVSPRPLDYSSQKIRALLKVQDLQRSALENFNLDTEKIVGKTYYTDFSTRPDERKDWYKCESCRII